MYGLFSSIIRTFGVQVMHIQVIIKKIENIQRLFTRMLFFRCNLLNINYNDRLKFLDLCSLSELRFRIDLVTAFKLTNGLVDVDASNIIDIYVNNMRGPSTKLRMDLCKYKTTINFFHNRVAKP